MKIRQFFVASKILSFLSPKQILDAEEDLDSKPIEINHFSKFFRFIYFMLRVNFEEISLLYLNKF